jgi:hypothetical protein
VIKGILDQVVLLVSKDLKDQGVVPEVMEKLVPKETQGSLAPRDYQDPQELMYIHHCNEKHNVLSLIGTTWTYWTSGT